MIRLCSTSRKEERGGGGPLRSANRSRELLVIEVTPNTLWHRSRTSWNRIALFGFHQYDMKRSGNENCHRNEDDNHLRESLIAYASSPSASRGTALRESRQQSDETHSISFRFREQRIRACLDKEQVQLDSTCVHARRRKMLCKLSPWLLLKLAMNKTVHRVNVRHTGLDH